MEDTLEFPKNWGQTIRQKIDLGKLSVLITNLPFSAKIPVRGEDKLKQLELGHKWKRDNKYSEWKKGK